MTEQDGSVEVCVEIYTGTVDMPDSVTVQTMSGTARSKRM